MIVFNLDTKPQNEDLTICNDYTAKIFRAAMSIPLLKFNITNFEFSSGLCNIVTRTNKKIILSINDFYFSDGEKLTPYHIKHRIEQLKKTNYKFKYLLKELKQLKVKNNNLIIYHKKNIMFIYVLTNINFSPINKSGAFCGYFMANGNDEKSFKIKNNTYNLKKNIDIKFNYFKNHDNDIESFFQGKCNYTNPTTFPINQLDRCKNNLICYPSYISFNITFTNKKLLNFKFNDLRKIIFFGIDREAICKKFFPLIYPAYDFLLFTNNKNEIVHNNIKYKEPIYLTMGYDPFYPNLEICKFIKKSLEKVNIYIELKVTNFYDRKNNCDLQLNLTYPDYFENSYYYCSRYFELLIKLCNYKVYKKFITYKKKFIKTGQSTDLKKCFDIFNNLNLQIPLFNSNAVYLSKDKKFNFVNLDYSVFK